MVVAFGNQSLSVVVLEISSNPFKNSALAYT